MTPQSSLAQPEQQVLALWLYAEEPFPNNPQLPLLVYHRALVLIGDDPASQIERLFERNGWFNGWRNGVYDVHHYHSTAHEVLGCYRGEARLQLGGPSGPLIVIERSDVLVIPAGVSHRRAEASRDFAVVGAYANGQTWDTCFGELEDLASAEPRIASVALPRADPVHGPRGPLLQHWLH
jgi:uncharacterized protein YjlB